MVGLLAWYDAEELVAALLVGEPFPWTENVQMYILV